MSRRSDRLDANDNIARACRYRLRELRRLGPSFNQFGGAYDMGSRLQMSRICQSSVILWSLVGCTPPAPSSPVATPAQSLTGDRHTSALSGVSGLPGATDKPDMTGMIQRNATQQCEQMQRQMSGPAASAKDMQAKMAKCDALREGESRDLGAPAR